jgi:hypothetical protein
MLMTRMKMSMKRGHARLAIDDVGGLDVIIEG